MDFDDLLWDDGQGGASVGFTTGTGTVTETVTYPHGSRSITFTAESGNASLYQIQDRHGGAQSSVTFGFSGIGTATVTETINGSDATTVLTYGQVSGSTTQYQLTGETVTFTGSPDLTYSFTQGGGKVTAVSVSDTDGSVTRTHNLPIAPDASFTIGSGTITEILAVDNKVETLTYTAGTGGAYSLTSIATKIVAQGSASTALDIDAYDRAQFAVSGTSVTAASRVNADGSTTVIPSDSHVTYSVLATGYVEESITWGSHSLYKVFYSAGGTTPYTSVAEGSGSTVDLVGLKAQIAELPIAVSALL